MNAIPLFPDTVCRGIVAFPTRASATSGKVNPAYEAHHCHVCHHWHLRKKNP